MGSDYGDFCREMKDHKRAMRLKFGVNCPRCKEVRPKAHPSILLPQQKCKVDGYVDPRPRLTQEDHASVENGS